MASSIVIKFKISNEQSEEKTVINLLNEINTTLRQSSTANLQQELGQLVSAMSSFIESTSKSREDMQNLSATMNSQSIMIKTLINELTKSIAELGKTQTQNLSDLSAKIIESGNQQAKHLDNMNKLIQDMKSAIDDSKKNSEELLIETKQYQEQSLKNDDSLAQILSANTSKIIEMKQAFDNFLNNMAENYSKHLLEALTQSMDGLNNQLQEHFGENFKALNAAVKDVVTWQENYEEIITKTTGELQRLNENFETLTQTVAPMFDKHIENLATNIKIFAETSKENIDIQNNLKNSTETLSQAVQDAKASVEQMQNITESFGEFSTEVISKNNQAIEQYREGVKKNLEIVKDANKEFAKEIKDLHGQAINVEIDVEDAISKFGDASKGSLKGVQETLENFNTELSSATTGTISKALSNISGALAEITGTMIGNYQNLILKIAEVDKLLAERRNAK